EAVALETKLQEIEVDLKQLETSLNGIGIILPDRAYWEHLPGFYPYANEETELDKLVIEYRQYADEYKKIQNPQTPIRKQRAVNLEARISVSMIEVRDLARKIEEKMKKEKKNGDDSSEEEFHDADSGDKDAGWI
ncbi:hypothetical protein N9E76_01365, partial [bacterium]|nr:hypothetical protein [bacterium]